MGALNLRQGDNFSDIKIYDEIHKLLEEIKELEKKFEKFDIEKIEEKEELVEFEEPEILEEFQIVQDKEEIKNPKFKNEVKKLEPEFRIKKVKIEKQINPVTFRYRFNNEGKFENIDLKKRKLKTKYKKSFILKRIKIRKKERIVSKDINEKSKFTKLKIGLAKLKRVIPNKSIEVEKTEETANKE